MKLKYLLLKVVAVSVVLIAVLGVYVWAGVQTARGNLDVAIVTLCWLIVLDSLYRGVKNTLIDRDNKRIDRENEEERESLRKLVREALGKDEGREDYGYYYWHDYEEGDYPHICVVPWFQCPKYEVKLTSEKIVGGVIFAEKGFISKEGKGFAGTVRYWRNARV